mmetsp:Transcript_13404/g.20962  ORF Transcript_13404/g.20962 Transcript_13404/m.20962 type:complete len:86 (+) Transcript_13404:67-324(+)
MQGELHKQIPEFDFTNSHKRIYHHKYLCPDGDLFQSKGAISYEEAMEKELVNDNVLGGFHAQDRKEREEEAREEEEEEQHVKDEL